MENFYTREYLAKDTIFEQTPHEILSGITDLNDNFKTQVDDILSHCILGLKIAYARSVDYDHKNIQYYIGKDGNDKIFIQGKKTPKSLRSIVEDFRLIVQTLEDKGLDQKVSREYLGQLEELELKHSFGQGYADRYRNVRKGIVKPINL